MGFCLIRCTHFSYTEEKAQPAKFVSFESPNKQTFYGDNQHARSLTQFPVQSRMSTNEDFES